MDINEFEKAIKDIDRNKYHICRSLGFDRDGNFYLESWEIFRKDMSIEEYFNPDNLAVLSSYNGNTIEDIRKFVEESHES
jgi:hypothetical protein